MAASKAGTLVKIVKPTTAYSEAIHSRDTFNIRVDSSSW